MDTSLKTSIIPDDAVANLRNLVRDYYYFKAMQVTVVLKLNAAFKISFPAYPQVFSKITTQTSLKLLLVYPLATKKGKPGETTYFAGFVEYMPTFDISVFKEIRKYLCDFLKGTIIGRIVLHKKLPFTVFCSIDFDVCP